MHVLKKVAIGAASAGTALAQAATPYYDAESGITYSSITHENGVTYRVALPVETTVSDAIFQIVAPSTMGWCGLAWGGRMANNPLSVSWPTGSTDGQQVIISSRMAFGYYATPATYDGAIYTYFSGIEANETHWQITARCQGCTQWDDTNIHTEDFAVLAYACATTPPDEPASNSSNFNMHDQFGIWGHDLTIAKNASFADWVANNTPTEQVAERRWYA